MKTLRATIAAGLLSLLGIGSAFAQPANIGYHTVMGRLGAQAGDVGPWQQIPFATLLAQMNAVSTGRNINTTAPLAGGGSLATDLTLSLNIGAGLTASGGSLILANPAASTLGGVKSLTCASHQWLNTIAITGLPACAQPTAADVSGGAALTGNSDTNVTVTLGGTPASSLLAATSITMGWTGTLAVGRGGTGIGSGTSGGVPYYSASGTMASSGVLTTNQLALGGGAGGAPAPLGSWGSATTVLHGAAGTGAPTFGAVALGTDVSGQLPVANGGTNCATASPACLDNITGFSGTGFLTRTGPGSYSAQSTTNGITNANLAQGGAATLKGNPTGSTASVQDFTIQGLTNTAPNSTLDFIPFYNHTTGTIQAATPSQISSAVGSGVTSLNSLTGALSIVAGTGISVTPSGSNVTVAVNPGQWVLLNTLKASNSATLSDTTSLTATYNEYQIVFENVIPATASTSCEILVHSGGSFQATSYLSTGAVFSGASVIGQSATTYMGCSQSGSISNSSPGISGTFTIYKPSGATASKNWTGQASHFNGSAMVGLDLAGIWNSTAAIDGFQVLFSSGNITSGVIKVYGRS